MSRYLTISPAEWPAGFRIALFPYQGDVEAVASALALVDGFEPIVLRVEIGTNSSIRNAATTAPGEYLLLAPEQADHWEAAFDLCGGRPDATVAYLWENPSLEVTRARRAASTELLQTDATRGETVAFDVLVDGGYVGHWAETSDGAAVSWVKGEIVPTEMCAGEHDRIVAAIRPTIPAFHLQSSGCGHDESQPLPFAESELAALDGREQQVLRMRYGLGAKRLSLNEVGQRIGVTRERVRQIQNGALSKIRRQRNAR